jgi:hypothetical protein
MTGRRCTGRQILEDTLESATANSHPLLVLTSCVRSRPLSGSTFSPVYENNEQCRLEVASLFLLLVNREIDGHSIVTTTMSSWALAIINFIS